MPVRRPADSSLRASPADQITTCRDSGFVQPGAAADPARRGGFHALMALLGGPGR
jgi:hypothetical protein